MRIAYFHTEFAYSGGAERIVFEEIKALEKKGHEVICFTSFIDRTNCYPKTIAHYKVRQILPEYINKFFPHDFIIVLTTLLFFTTSLKYKGFDLYYGANQAGPWWAYLASLVWRKPYFTYQNYPTTVTYPRKIDTAEKRNSVLVNIIIDVAKPIMVWFDKKVIRNAKVCFANGEYVTKVCEKAYGRDFVNCPGGTFNAEFDKKIHDLRSKGTVKLNGVNIPKPYILVTNRHFPAKRFDYAVYALKYLFDKKINISLVLAGAKTEYTKEVLDLAKKLGVAGKIYLPGLLEKSNLVQAYKNALVYIYTAPEEDFGLGNIEAFAYGVPVLSWNNAGPKYIIKDSVTGYLAQKGNKKDFGEKLLRLVTDKALNHKMAKNAYKESKKYTWENHCEIILKGIKKVKI